ncbi:MAG: ATP-binding protein, partial [Chloroflexi bacterium]
QLHQREADIEFNLCEEVAIRITDYDFSKIVEEIIDNAIKFSKPGTAIKVTSFYDQDYFTFTVTDHGCGMSQKQINAIGAYMQFERWLYEQQGSGLGLAIVKRFVELYDGSIIITSVPQKETSVTIRIPRCG